jgi:hypothetical protein
LSIPTVDYTDYEYEVLDLNTFERVLTKPDSEAHANIRLLLAEMKSLTASYTGNDIINIATSKDYDPVIVSRYTSIDFGFIVLDEEEVKSAKKLLVGPAAKDGHKLLDPVSVPFSKGEVDRAEVSKLIAGKYLYTVRHTVFLDGESSFIIRAAE